MKKKYIILDAETEKQIGSVKAYSEDDAEMEWLMDHFEDADRDLLITPVSGVAAAVA